MEKVMTVNGDVKHNFAAAVKEKLPPEYGMDVVAVCITSRNRKKKRRDGYIEGRGWVLGMEKFLHFPEFLIKFKYF